jgi:hypothetical protein
VGEIRRAVQGIDEPPAIAPGAAALLGQDGVLGERAAQSVQEETFRAKVEVGHQVDDPFVPNGIDGTEA